MNGFNPAGPGTFWSLLGRIERESLHAIGWVREFAPRETLGDRDALPDSVTVLLDGYAKEVYGSAEGDESIIEIFGPGHLEGELTLWDCPQRGRIETLTPVRVLQVPKDRFVNFLAQELSAGSALMKSLGHRRVLAARRRAPGPGVRAPARIALHLIELALRFGRPLGTGTLIGPPLTQAELASFAGVDRVAVARAFHVWRPQGPRASCAHRHLDIVEQHGSTITVKDMAGLREAAGPWAAEWEPPPAVAAPARPPAATRQIPAIRIPAGGGSPAQLPPEVPCFTGRGASLEALDAMVAAADRPRAVIVEGMAGVGKSALATHWGHSVKDEHFSGGQLYLDLNGAPNRQLTTAEALGRLLLGLGLSGHQMPVDEHDLVALYRRHLADRRMLVVVENAGENPELIRPLVPPSNRCLLLVTTQAKLAGEPGLAPADGVEPLSLDVMPEEEAIQLMTAVLGPGDSRVRENRADATRLVRQCAMLPLALRITAARLAENPAERIADTVRDLDGQDRLSKLAQDDEPRAAVRPAFEVSYRALPPDLRRTFRYLGLLPGSDATAEAGAALLDETAPDTLARLQALHRLHLVSAEGDRFTVHGLLRVFARERVLLEDSEIERTGAVRRLLTHYLATAMRAGDALGRPRRPARDRAARPPAAEAPATASRDAERERHLAWFESERANLVAAAHQAARHGLHSYAFNLADAVYDFMTSRGYVRDVIDVHKAGLASAQAEDDWPATAKMLHHLAIAHRSIGANVKALSYGEDARWGFRRLGDSLGEADALDNLADVRGVLGRYRLAIEHSTESLHLHRRARNRAGEAEALDTISQNLRRLGEYVSAEDYALRALTIRKEIGDTAGEAETLLNLARLHYYWGAPRTAVVHALEALSLRVDLGGRPQSADAYRELARIHRQVGLPGLARRDAEQALRISRASGDRHGEGETLIVLGKLLRDEGAHAEALSRLWHAVRLTHDIGHKRGQAEARAAIGVVYFKLGRYAESREHLNLALEIRREIADRAGEAHDLENLSRTMRRLARYEDALQHGLDALKLWRDLDVALGEARTLGGLARAYARLGLTWEALNAAETSLSIHERQDEGMGVALDTMARILLRMGRPREALERAVRAVGLMREMCDRQHEGCATNNLARIHLALGHPDEAERHARQALDIVKEAGDLREQAACRHTLGLVAQYRGDHAGALRDLEENLRLHRETGNHLGQVEALTALRLSYEALGNVRETRECEQRVQNIQRWVGGA
ncbi:tetratricopeptide repeat protein [Sphaerisporangium sp. TRM90804]|uniref:tetratricopeptide repeat protein n=1 Tax=Sphaerisporangium sp. TRM90804 TaxID=3031113 RepID=UPI00244CD236|nr:tetratricopeptide repeat protein [Sphaerisporangium sp. TRM90804]MDH2426945.1 tetratricopeptide repeat protein [Sphaerisporangium sp. TRM90804]